MGGLSVSAKARALSAVFGTKALTIGLASSLNGRGVLSELAADGYARQQVAFDDPDDLGRIRNKTAVQFPPFAATTGEPIRFWFVMGAKDELLASGEIVQEMFDPETGDVYDPAAAAAATKELRGRWQKVLAGRAISIPPGYLTVRIGEGE